MCGRMIFPTIARNLGILAGHGEQFSPEDTDTIESIFAGHRENLTPGLNLLKDLTLGADGTITANMTILELKRMVMQSSERHIAKMLTLPQIRALQAHVSA